jgi:hypothetical protein
MYALLAYLLAKHVPVALNVLHAEQTKHCVILMELTVSTNAHKLLLSKIASPTPVIFVHHNALDAQEI